MRLTTAAFCLLGSAAWAATQPAGSTATKPAATAPAGDSLAATVNGHKIMESDVDEEIRTLATRNARGSEVDESLISRLRSVYRDQILQFLINEELVEEQVAKEKISATDKEVSDRVDDMVAATLRIRSMSREDLEAEIKSQQGVSLDEAVAKAKADPMQKKGLLRERLIEKKMPEQIKVSDEEIKKFYEQNNQSFNQPERVRASHILIMTRDMKTDAEKAAAKKKAEEVLAKARKPDADFAALAKEYSDCPSKSLGGDLNWFTRDRMVAPFSAAAFAMKEGQISDVVETEFGYHVIKVTGKKEPTTTTLEQAKEDIRRQLHQQKLNEAGQEYVRQLRDQAKITYPPGKEPNTQPVRERGLGARSTSTRPATPAPPTAKPIPKDAIKITK